MTTTNFPTALRFLDLYTRWRQDKLTETETREFWMLEAALG